MDASFLASRNDGLACVQAQNLFLFDFLGTELLCHTITFLFYGLQTTAMLECRPTLGRLAGLIRIPQLHYCGLREQGKLIGALSSGEDITERRKAEEALRTS